MTISTSSRFYGNIIKGKKTFTLLGLCFALGAIFILTPVLLFVQDKITEPYQKYNYDKIVTDGKSVMGKVKSVEINFNISHNNVSPRIITYEYRNGSSNATEKFQTLETDKADALNPGDVISIAVLGDQSVIKGIRAYKFPFYILWILPAVFLVLGIVFYYIGRHARAQGTARDQ